MRNYNEGYEGSGWEPRGTRPYVERLEGELDVEYQDFAAFVGGFKEVEPENRKDRRTTHNILRGGAALAYNTSGKVFSHPDQVPAAVRQEWTAYQDGTYVTSSPKGGRWRRVGIGGAIATVAAAVVVSAGLMSQSNETSDKAREAIATNADSLRALGICATDMRMQLQYDQTKDVSSNQRKYVKNDVHIDVLAIKTAEDAGLPCVKHPDENASVVVQESRPQRAATTSLYRLAMTEFVAADWRTQRADLQHQINTAGEDGDYKDCQQMISAGNEVINSINTGGVIHY